MIIFFIVTLTFGIVTFLVSLFFAGTLVFEVLIFVFVLGDLGGLFISLVDCKFYLL